MNTDVILIFLSCCALSPVYPFENPSLLVPDGCLFDHTADLDTCMPKEDLKEVAKKQCSGRGKKLDSFAVILPCQSDLLFTGVEFVCCAQDSTLNIEKRPSQHEAFEEEKMDLDQKEQDKLDQLRADWLSALGDLERLEAIDPKGAAKKRAEISSQYQASYKNLIDQIEREREGLDLLYQQKHDAHINEKKAHTYSAYITALQDMDVGASQIYKKLKHYIEAEQRDRVHSMNRYEKTLTRNPEEGAISLEALVKHLAVIDERLEAALELLSTRPDVEADVKSQAVQLIDENRADDHGFAWAKDVLDRVAQADSQMIDTGGLYPPPPPPFSL